MSTDYDANHSVRAEDAGADQRDNALLESLSALVLELDHQATSVYRGQSASNRSTLFLKFLCESVNRVIELIEMTRLADEDEVSLIEALRAANRLYPEARLLHGRKGNRLSVGSALLLFEKWAEALEDRSYFFRHIALAMVYVIENFFLVIGRLFRQEQAAGEWGEISGCYLKRVRDMAEKVEF